nr:hypothetical protein SO190N17_000006 [Saccharum officinarum]
MQLPDNTAMQGLTNRFLNEELNYDRDTIQKKSVGKLNLDQKKAFDTIIHSLGKLIFVNGYGGTGKTFLWKAITTSLRAEGKIVLAVASSGIAALLLPGGRTAHSRFHIPLNINNESTCDFKQGTFLAERLSKISLILWDEASMTNKHCFKALGVCLDEKVGVKRSERGLDKSLRDIHRLTNDNSQDKPFGGMTNIEERAILCPRNEMVDDIHYYIMSQIPGQETTYFSSDTNINRSASPCNGTRLTITQLGKWLIEAQRITGTNIWK